MKPEAGPGEWRTRENGDGFALNVATLNLFNFLAPPFAAYEFDRIYTHKQWQKKCDWLRHCLRSLDADIIGFQEVFSPAELQALLAELGYRHFAVMDTPACEDFVCRAPVVALASRLPLTQLTAVTPAAEALAAMALPADYAFGRKPLRATVSLPPWGSLDIYVLHLKSPRPSFEPNALSALDPLPKLLAHQAMGNFASRARRGFEAMLLYHGILLRRQQSGLPFLLMGDFNGPLDAPEFAGLWQHGAAFHPADRQAAGVGALGQEELQDRLAQFAIRDAAELYLEALRLDSPESDWRRHPTHYLGARGSLLDHILLSHDFDAAEPGARGRVHHFALFDEHLRRPLFERDSESSDHAALLAGLALF